MDSKKLVVVEPDSQIVFVPQINGQLKGQLTIKNVSSGNVAYKIKTTAPQFYIVKPNQGILASGQKIYVDIGIISDATNKIEDNKFLIMFAETYMSHSEAQSLAQYWDNIEKSKINSIKLKVSTSQEPQLLLDSFEKKLLDQDQQPAAPSQLRKSLGGENQFAYFSQNQAQFFEQMNPPLKQDESIHNKSESETNIIPTLATSQLVNNENITKKLEELRKQYDTIVQEKQTLANEIKEIVTKQVETAECSKELYEWQQPDIKTQFSFQLIHVIITALIWFMIGGYLGDGHHIHHDLSGSTNQTLQQ